MNAVTTDEKLVYDEATDSFIYQDSNYPEEEWAKFDATVIEGKKIYSIGGWSWCWSAEEIE
ncbi:hypothetical protein A8E71_16475 [Burkholderia cenocepacia]|uniref:Uncharacterized protein n=2 Tax=Burkholderiales TaxID=80840 RepID=A0A1V2VTT5_9BURK|nr:hypothetical protein A8E72_34040 [Burkholderia cenocepacia]ONU79498.1 hypothetical protein A8E73_22125 [Burkholderia cenocepacia]ONV09111.1 hypothetical protein A8E71_16475 [Burkholderia cenocepacia]ONV10719.1 hypothetical protein A8E69_05825 [Burkholderia cenocepacia]